LYFDFQYRGIRCREMTALADTPANRRAVDAVATRIKREIAKGSFDYSAFFPDSPKAAKFSVLNTSPSGKSTSTSNPTSVVPAIPECTPTLAEFSETWYSENRPRWRDSHADNTRCTIDGHITPKLGDKPIGTITRAELLAFRGELGKLKNKNGVTISASRINHIMTPLRMLLAEAAERHGFVSPFRNIKPLRLPKVDIQPFSLEEVNKILESVRKDWRPYLTTRFFTGLRTGEINGLEWKHIDFERDLILVRQTIVKGKLENTKTDGSMREIAMVPAVRSALLEQRNLMAEECRWVFGTRNGEPINLVNFTNRIWKPLLRYLGLAQRRPYQTRHTAATLMLGSGENPEWVARTLGHVNTEMLFRVYSRYVPNLTRNDGKAFVGLVSSSGGMTPMQERPNTEDLPASLSMLSRNQLEAMVRALAVSKPKEDEHVA
jgi:integrase